MKKFEEDLQESNAINPVAFDKFCQQRIEKFRQIATTQISTTNRIKLKLQKLIEMICFLHKPGCRGKFVNLDTIRFYY